MRQIRQFLAMATLAVMGAMMAGCATEDNVIVDVQQPADQTRTITLTTTVTLDGGSATRALTESGVKTFAIGDQIAVRYKYDNYSSKTELSAPLEETDISTDGKTATFTVTLTETPDEGCEVRYIYPATMEDDWDRDTKIQNEQDGTLTTLASTFDYCEGTGTMGGTAPNFVLPTGVTLKNQLALAKFTVKDGSSDGASDITSGVTQLMIDDGTRGYVVNRTAAAGPIWVAMYPIAKTQTVKVTAVKGTDLYQSADITNKELAKNNYYDITVTTPQIVMSDIAAVYQQPLTFEAREGAANFKNTIIIMTSNATREQLKATMRPEFLNRIDEIITFTPLTKEQISDVVRLQMKKVTDMLEPQGIHLECTPQAIAFLAEEGYDPDFGARPVKRAIQQFVLNDLSKKLLADEVDREKPIIIDEFGDGLVFRN